MAIARSHRSTSLRRRFDDAGRMVGQPVDHLAFALVTPLSTDDDNVGQGHSGPKPLLSTKEEDLRSSDPPSKGSPKRIESQAPRVAPVSAFKRHVEKGPVDERSAHEPRNGELQLFDNDGLRLRLVDRLIPGLLPPAEPNSAPSSCA